MTITDPTFLSELVEYIIDSHEKSYPNKKINIRCFFCSSFMDTDEILYGMIWKYSQHFKFREILNTLDVNTNHSIAQTVDDNMVIINLIYYCLETLDVAVKNSMKTYSDSFYNYLYDYHSDIFKSLQKLYKYLSSIINTDMIDIELKRKLKTLKTILKTLPFLFR